MDEPIIEDQIRENLQQADSGGLGGEVIGEVVETAFDAVCEVAGELVTGMLEAL